MRCASYLYDSIPVTEATNEGREGWKKDGEQAPGPAPGGEKERGGEGSGGENKP